MIYYVMYFRNQYNATLYHLILKDISEENNRLRQRNQPPNNKVHLESSSLYLIKKQLVPHDDLLLLPWKAAAFYDALTAPIWNVLKTKWEVVEQFIRRLANVSVFVEQYNY